MTMCRYGHVGQRDEKDRHDIRTVRGQDTNGKLCFVFEMGGGVVGHESQTEFVVVNNGISTDTVSNMTCQ